jgi:hypothetical protein
MLSRFNRWQAMAAADDVAEQRRREREAEWEEWKRRGQPRGRTFSAESDRRFR